MILNNPVLCASDALYFYRFSWFWISCICCHQPNQIRSWLYIFYIGCLQTNHIYSITSLTMMGLTPGPLVRALLHFVLMNLLVVLVSWGLAFLYHQELISNVTFWVCHVCRIRSQVERWLTHRNVLVLKFLIFPPNLKISFVVIVMVCLFHTYSGHCSFTKNKIQHAPIWSIHWPSNSGIRSTEYNAFIQCVDVPHSASIIVLLLV